MYKEPGGLRYAFYSSKDGNVRATKLQPLRKQFRINSPNSPLLQTIYQVQSQKADPETVWLAWNDQPEQDSDAFGQPVTASHGHAKGFAAVRAHRNAQKGNAKVSSFIIQTSLPKFPRLPRSGKSSTSTRYRQLPSQPWDVFSSNAVENAQHFLCLSPSVVRKVDVDQDGEYGQEWLKESDFGSGTVFGFLNKYLTTIHPGIVGTNFDEQVHASWRRFFSAYIKPIAKMTEKQLGSRRRYDAKLLPRTTSSRATVHPYPSRKRIFCLSGPTYEYDAESKTVSNTNIAKSQWTGTLHRHHGCDEGNESECIVFGKLNTTAHDSIKPIEWSYFAKNGARLLHMYDDFAALFLVKAQRGLPYTASPKQLQAHYVLLVQHWMDAKTLENNFNRQIYDTSTSVEALVDIVNIDGIGHMPKANSKSRSFQSQSTDHSKWTIGFALDSINGLEPMLTDGAKGDPSTGHRQFLPYFAAGDLNRTASQRQLKGKSHGRSGGLIGTLEIPTLCVAMLNLQPQISSYVAHDEIRRDRKLQSKLEGTIPVASKHYTGSETLPVKDYRNRLLDILNRPSEINRTLTDPIPFDVLLQELRQFVYLSHMQEERIAFTAFKYFIQNIVQKSGSKRINAAQRAWTIANTLKPALNVAEDSVDHVQTLPELRITRSISSLGVDVMDHRTPKAGPARHKKVLMAPELTNPVRNETTLPVVYKVPEWLVDGAEAPRMKNAGDKKRTGGNDGVPAETLRELHNALRAITPIGKANKKPGPER